MLLSTLLGITAVFVSTSAPKAVPECASCAAFCSGTCSFSGPPEQARYPLGIPRNFSVIRMTPTTIRGLTNKNTGTVGGDLSFVMREIAAPMNCRHLSPAQANKSSMCNGGATPSWLERQPLIYVQWTLETDGFFGK